MEISIENLHLLNLLEDIKNLLLTNSKKNLSQNLLENLTNNSIGNPLKKYETSFNPKLKDINCFKCNKKGHTSNFCKLSKKLHELQLEEETLQKITAFSFFF